ncbi:MAG: hypothetical protein D6702_03835 [Planctomycetota bacterium]|nr:MAG: hypothetical protein D6702_03835 [Planctomycetota bacterium]
MIPTPSFPSPSDPWFDPQTFGAWFGGLGGALVGLLGGLTGAAGTFLAPRGRARRFVLGSLLVQALVGAVLLLLGVAAVLVGQPYGIWFPPVLIGGLCLGLGGGLRPEMARRYRAAEERRIEAEALRG